MKIPFYTDSEKLSSGDSSDMWMVSIIYMVLVIGTFKTLEYFDHVQSKIIKLLLAVIIIGLPCLIITIVKRNIWRHGDEFLQSLYLKHTAYNGLGFLFVFIAWQLWGRITNDPMWDNLAISITPYITLITIFSAVRREIRKISHTSKIKNEK